MLKDHYANLSTRARAYTHTNGSHARACSLTGSLTQTHTYYAIGNWPANTMGGLLVSLQINAANLIGIMYVYLYIRLRALTHTHTHACTHLYVYILIPHADVIYLYIYIIQYNIYRCSETIGRRVYIIIYAYNIYITK